MTEDQVQTLLQFQKDILAEDQLVKASSPEDRLAARTKLWELSEKYFDYTVKEFADPRTLDPERTKSLFDAIQQSFKVKVVDTLDADVLRAMQPELAVVAVTRNLIGRKVAWSLPDMPGLNKFAERNHTFISGKIIEENQAPVISGVEVIT